MASGGRAAPPPVGFDLIGEDLEGSVEQGDGRVGMTTGATPGDAGSLVVKSSDIRAAGPSGVHCGQC